MGIFSEDQPKRYEIANKQLICMFCGNDTFHTRTEQLQSPGLTFLDIEWADSTATCFICISCGYLHSFMRK
jgi:ribosomal protein L37E